MPRLTNVEMLEQNQQHALTIRTRCKVEDLPRIIGESYGKIGAYLGELKEGLMDVPFVAYHNLDMENLDVEMGFPVVKQLPERAEIKSVMIPAGKIAFCMYLGAYAEIEPVYNDMYKWIKDNGYEALFPSYEYYYNGPETKESELLTKIVMPIK